MPRMEETRRGGRKEDRGVRGSPRGAEGAGDRRALPLLPQAPAPRPQLSAQLVPHSYQLVTPGL